MSATVPETCPIVSAAGVVSADPVRGATWQDLGAASNHLLGRGGVLLPLTALGAPTATKGTTLTYRIALWPRYQATHRVWTVVVAPADAGAEGIVSFADPSGGSSFWSVTNRTPPTSYRHVETITSRTGSQVDVTVSITVDGSGVDCVPVALGCYEVARPELALDANDGGVDLRDLGGGMPIYASTGHSIGGVIDGSEAAVSVVRRCGLLYALRDAVSPFSFTTTSYVNPLAGVSEALDRKLYRSETVRACNVRAYGSTGATTTMDVRLSATNGDSLVLSWAAGDSGSWKFGTFDVNVEDLADARGLQGGAPDLITIEGKRTTGSNAAHLTSVCVAGT